MLWLERKDIVSTVLNMKCLGNVELLEHRENHCNLELAAGNSEPGVTVVDSFHSGLENRNLAYPFWSPGDAESVCGCYCLKLHTPESLNIS